MKDVFSEILSNPTVHVVGLAILLAVVALWLAAAWWAYNDASRRRESSLVGFGAAAWIILSTPLLLPLSLGIYAMARPQATASDDRTQSLMVRLQEIAGDRPTCPTCDAAVDADWIRCPMCATWFAFGCESCGELSAAGLEVCPFCGADREPIPAGWAAADSADSGHGKAAAGKPAAAVRSAGAPRLQRGRMASSWRPASYEASRASSSVSS
jgi:RNA polymerase subunit RPABC4/transcription elongation factor Spt4